jgi:hypothetical protein
LLVVRTSRQKLRRRLKWKEMKPSEYLAKHFGIVLPSNIAELWDVDSYVDDSGNIVLRDASSEVVAGYWSSFDKNLAGHLSWYLFNDDPNFHVSACEPGMRCEVSEDSSAHFEFRVYDSTGKALFAGTIVGKAEAEYTEDWEEIWVEFSPEYIVIRPLSRAGSEPWVTTTTATYYM